MECDEDYAFALHLQQSLQQNFSSPERPVKKTSPAEVSPVNQKGKSLSIIDQQWELIDPTPDIHALFIQFNERFFWGRLGGVEVRWSPRMTMCAGMCVYQGKGGLCSVRLSLPLLKLRPRKDLVETLLHEMIHAYLFITNNNKDHDGHGPEFQKHMNRINQETGTRISIYHTFHDEVAEYRQHWWRCDGPCQRKHPFFGIVRRASNRAPGPSDRWHEEHQRLCGGIFHKIREPEGYTQKIRDQGKRPEKKSKAVKGGQDIRSFFNGTTKTPNTSRAINGSGDNIRGFDSGKSSGTVSNTKINNVGGFGKGTSDTTRGNVHGFGSRGGVVANKGSGTLVVTSRNSNATERRNVSTTSKPTSSVVPFSGAGHVLGSTQTYRTKDGHTQSVTFSPNKNYKSLSPQKIKIEKYVDRYVKALESSGVKKTLSFEKSSASIKSRSPSVDRQSNDSQSLLQETDEQPFQEASTESPIKVNVQKYADNYFKMLNKSQESSKGAGPSRGDANDEAVSAARATDNVIISDSGSDTDMENEPSVDTEKVPRLADCPVCGRRVPRDKLEAHVDSCLSSVPEFMDNSVVDITEESDDSSYPCPVCHTRLSESDMNTHLDVCLTSVDFTDSMEY